MSDPRVCGTTARAPFDGTGTLVVPDGLFLGCNSHSRPDEIAIEGYEGWVMTFIEF